MTGISFGSLKVGEKYIEGFFLRFNLKKFPWGAKARITYFVSKGFGKAANVSQFLGENILKIVTSVLILQSTRFDARGHCFDHYFKLFLPIFDGKKWCFF
jgi:hypothetical protein